MVLILDINAPLEVEIDPTPEPFLVDLEPPEMVIPWRR